jgi:post-segregation antitoxin (ccd killing protein)
LGYAICVFGIVAELGLMAQGLPEDRTWAALGLGDYPSAQKRVERVTNPDPSLERMVKRTLDVEVAVGTSADSLERAWSRWQERDLKAAADWASMAYIQGNLRAYLIVEILEFLEGEEPLRESLNPAKLPSPWRVELIVALSAARQAVRLEWERGGG